MADYSPIQKEKVRRGSRMSTAVAGTTAKGSLARRTKRRAARLGLKVADSYTRQEARNVRQLLAAQKSADPSKLGPTKAQKRKKRFSSSQGIGGTSTF